MSTATTTLYRDWEDLEEKFAAIVERDFADWIDPDEPHYEQNLAFALHRVTEGRQLVDFFLPKFQCSPIRVLDIGSGNGGISIALANHRGFAVTAVDRVPNRHLIAAVRTLGVPVNALVGDARRIPVASGHFDVVLCLDMIEHVKGPHEMGSEIMRALRPGGMCMVTTPARVPHLIGPDPHFGVKGLLLLPDHLQAAAVKRLRPEVKEYDVEHIFWSVGGIARCFPGRARVQTLVNIPYPGVPRTPLQIAHYLLRRLLWNRVLIWR